MKKGAILAIGAGVIFIIVMMVMIIVAFVAVLVVHGNKLRFEYAYAGADAKAFAVSEALLRSDIDGRTLMEHAMIYGITKKQESAGADFIWFSRAFLDKYDLKLYHIEISYKDSATGQDKTLDEYDNIATSCGTEKGCGPSKDQPCIAYCQLPVTYLLAKKGPNQIFGECDRGREKLVSPDTATYGKQDNLCLANEICCIEEYDFSANSFNANTIQQDEKCGQNKEGVCSFAYCEYGRLQIPEGNSHPCSGNVLYQQTASKWLQNLGFTQPAVCCKPMKPSQVVQTYTSEGAAIVPMLFVTDDKEKPENKEAFVEIGVGQ